MKYTNNIIAVGVPVHTVHPEITWSVSGNGSKPMDKDGIAPRVAVSVTILSARPETWLPSTDGILSAEKFEARRKYITREMDAWIRDKREAEAAAAHELVAGTIGRALMAAIMSLVKAGYVLDNGSLSKELPVLEGQEIA